MKLFVAGLPFDVDDQELQEIFEAYGTVGSAKVITDRETGKSRGFGFVEFPTDTEAQAAITALNGATLEGRELAVKVAEDKPKGSGGGGGGYRGGSGGGGGYNRGGGGGNRDRNRY
jgi:RNA recognition motif-containing protein